MEKWIEKAVGKMHTNHIKHKELAKYLGVSEQYISEILNGRTVSNGIGTKEKILNAIEEIISSKG